MSEIMVVATISHHGSMSLEPAVGVEGAVDAKVIPTCSGFRPMGFIRFNFRTPGREPQDNVTIRDTKTHGRWALV